MRTTTTGPAGSSANFGSTRLMPGTARCSAVAAVLRARAARVVVGAGRDDVVRSGCRPGDASSRRARTRCRARRGPASVGVVQDDERHLTGGRRGGRASTRCARHAPRSRAATCVVGGMRRLRAPAADVAGRRARRRWPSGRSGCGSATTATTRTTTPRAARRASGQSLARGGRRASWRRHPAAAVSAQTSMPSRRAERCRCRLARKRRSRLTSIGSAARAAGVSISALSTW